ncbi:hypothetical protein AgCh_033620 [Apium graveolens]
MMSDFGLAKLDEEENTHSAHELLGHCVHPSRVGKSSGNCRPGTWHKQEAISVLDIALLCTIPSPSLRPCMSAIVSMLQGKRKVEAPLFASNTTCDYTEFKGFENITLDRQTPLSMFSGESLGARSLSSMVRPWDGSSVSIPRIDTSRLTENRY